MENQGNYRIPEESFRVLGLDEGDIRHLLRTHRRIFIWVPIAAVVAAFVYCLLATPIFVTSALLYLQPNFDKDFQLEGGNIKSEDQDSLKSIEQAVISDTVILRTVDRLNLRNDPGYLMIEGNGEEALTDAALLKRVRKRYKAELLPSTRVLKLSVRDSSAERARVIAHTLVEEFLKLLRGELIKEGETLREALAVQADRALQGALKSEEALQEFRILNPDFLVEQDSIMFQERVLQYGRDLNEARAISARLKAVVEALLTIDPETNPFQVVEVVGAKNNQSVSELLRMHTAAEAELAAAKQLYGGRNPKYRVAEESLQQVQRSLRNYAAELKASAMSDYTASMCKADQLDASLREIQGTFVGFKSKSAQFRGLQAEVEKNWSVHSELQKKILNLTLNPDVSPMMAIPFSEPVLADQPSFPSKRLIVPGALGLSLLLVLGYVLAVNRRGLPFTSLDQLQSVLSGPVIPILDSARRPREGEEVREFVMERRLMGLPLALSPHRIVHISSSARNEGVGWLPAMLGESFVRSGYRTLLVRVRDGGVVFDCPLPTGPNAEDRFPKLPSADWLNSDQGATCELQTFDLPVAALVHREQFRTFLKGVLTGFERVVFDTTSVAEREAIVAVSQESESNVLVVAEGGELRLEVMSLAERMEANSAKAILGVYLHRRETEKARQGTSHDSAEPQGTWNWAGFAKRFQNYPCLEAKN